MVAAESEAANELKWTYKYAALISTSSYVTPCSLGLIAKINRYFAVSVCKINFLSFQEQITCKDVLFIIFIIICVYSTL